MKKNVKKVTIGVLSCSLLLTMSACTKKRSAEEVLQDSLKASAKQENITYKNPGKSVSVILPKDLSSYKLQKK